MRRILYVIIPATILGLVIFNAFFGDTLLSSMYDRSINKYSIYVHLQPEWKSYPGNILYDVTNVWSGYGNVDPSLHEINPDDISPLSTYNRNQLEYQNSKSYVELRHEFSACENDWKPISYRYVADSIRNWVEIVQGVQITGDVNVDASYQNAAQNDPYVWIFPNIHNSAYDTSLQDVFVSQGYAQFIPICTASVNSTTYDYSIMINDPEIGFDAYFVKSESDANAYVSGLEFDFYQQDGCYITNHNSFSGTCYDVHPDSGLLIVIPDRLDLSLTKIRINLHEHA